MRDNHKHHQSMTPEHTSSIDLTSDWQNKEQGRFNYSRRRSTAYEDEYRERR